MSKLFQEFIINLIKPTSSVSLKCRVLSVLQVVAAVTKRWKQCRFKKRPCHSCTGVTSVSVCSFSPIASLLFLRADAYILEIIFI